MLLYHTHRLCTTFLYTKATTSGRRSTTLRSPAVSLCPRATLVRSVDATCDSVNDTDGSCPHLRNVGSARQSAAMHAGARTFSSQRKLARSTSTSLPGDNDDNTGRRKLADLGRCSRRQSHGADVWCMDDGWCMPGDCWCIKLVTEGTDCCCTMCDASELANDIGRHAIGT